MPTSRSCSCTTRATARCAATASSRSRTGLIEEGLYPATAPATTIRWETPAGLVTATAATRERRGRAARPTPSASSTCRRYLHADRSLMRPRRRSARRGGRAAQRRSERAPRLRGRLLRHRRRGGAGPARRARAGRARCAGPEPPSPTSCGATTRRPTRPTRRSASSTARSSWTATPRTSPDGRARDATIRNVTVFADAEVDRSPCGSGTSALLAGSTRARRIRGRRRDRQRRASPARRSSGASKARTRLGDREAVITSIEGRGFVTGHHRFVVDERDPLGGRLPAAPDRDRLQPIEPPGLSYDMRSCPVCADCPEPPGSDPDGAFPSSWPTTRTSCTASPGG